MIPHALAGLIRRLDERPGRAPEGVVHVVLDAAGEPVDADPNTAWALQQFSPVTRHVYALHLDRRVEIRDAQEAVRPLLAEDAADLRFRFEVWALRGKAAQIVKALHHRTENPAQRLQSHLRDVLIELVRAEAAAGGVRRIGDLVLRDRQRWQEKVSAALAERTGLGSEIVFEGTARSETIHIRIGDLAVVPSDAAEAICHVTLNLTLEPDGAPPLDPLPSREERRTAFVEGLVAEIIRREVRLHALWYAHERAEEILRRRLGERLARTGYACTRIELLPSRQPLPRAVQVDVSLPWTGFRGRKVVFHLDAIMSLREDEGAARYHAAGRPERRAWLAERGAAALNTAMHGRDFHDLTIAEQAAVGDRVGEMLRREALAIGHDIKPVTPEVRLPEKRWLTPQVLEIARAVYPTKGGVDAEFSVSIQLRFDRIRPLIEHVDAGTEAGAAARGEDYNADIKAAILKLVGQTLRNVMATVEAEEYFAHWERWHEPFEASDAPEPANLVRNRLIREVRDVLVRRLGAAEVDVHLHQIRSERQRAIEDHLGRFGTFEVSGVADPAGRERRSEEVPFTLLVPLSGIDRDEAAAVMRRGVQHLDAARMESSLLAAAQEFLSGCSLEEMRELNPGPFSRHGEVPMKERLRNHLDRHMVRIYSVHIDLETATVGRSNAEEARRRGLSQRDDELLLHLDVIEHDQKQQRLAMREDAEGRRRRIQLLQAELEGNPRKSEEDRERYRETRQELDEALRDRDEAQRALARETLVQLSRLAGATSERGRGEAGPPDEGDAPARAAGPPAGGDAPGF